MNLNRADLLRLMSWRHRLALIDLLFLDASDQELFERLSAEDKIACADQAGVPEAHEETQRGMEAAQNLDLNRADLHRLVEWQNAAYQADRLAPGDAELLERIVVASALPDAVCAPADEQEWAQVEVFGHRRHFGRITEVERFGSKLMRIDVPTADPAVFETYFYGGGSIFSVAPCTEAVARRMAEANRPRAYLPRSTLPPGIDDDGGEC